jgi:hypothetical protein
MSSLDLVEQINDLLNNDRNQLKKEISSEIINKLISKRDNLKENFLLNLPFNYNNEKEFIDLYQRIEQLNINLKNLKTERSLISEKLADIHNEKETSIEKEIKPLIIQSIHIKRQLSYIKCMKKVEELK